MSLKLPRHRVLGPIASGGMGTVLLGLARDETGASRPVALKHLHAHLAADAQMVAMFVDEARLASRLAHPNVVRVTDVEMVKGDVVLVMDFIEGIPLSALLKKLRERGTPMPLPIARRIVHDVLLGLHAAHELRDDRGAPLGVVHRDVSPHNVLLGVDGLARITDFGVAKAHGRLASTETGGAVKGKVQYLSPEQLNRKDLDRRVDVFATGIVLWECLTGRGLFAGESVGAILSAIVSEPIAPPSAHRFDVSLELDEICLRALERDPKRRWATAEEFARALEAEPLADPAELGRLVAEAGAESIAAHRALLAGAQDNVTTPAIALEAPEAPPRRRRPFVGVAVAVAVGAIGGGLLTSRLAPRATPSSPPAPIATSEPSATASAPTPVEAPAPSASTAAAASSASAAPAPKSARPRGPGRTKRAADGGTIHRFEPDDL